MTSVKPREMGFSDTCFSTTGFCVAGTAAALTGADVLATTSAYIAALIEIDLWVRQFRKKEHCMVIFEDNVRSRQTMKDMHRHFQQKSIASLLAEEDLKYLPLRRIREDPTFQPKRPGHPLAIADMVAFVLKRHLMNDPWISCYFDLLIPQLAVMQLKDYKGSQQSYQS